MQVVIPEKVILKAIQQQYYNKTEAANYCGVSLPTFQKWRKENVIPTTIVEGQVLFAKDDLKRFMEEHRK